ncbi:MAG: DUF3644 domain-containing protein [Pseudomonadota bacterium]
MASRSKKGSLTGSERRIAKALLALGWRNQDIQDLINQGRNATINSARITEVKKDEQQKPAGKKETDLYIAKKAAIDPKTGLNLYDDERLVRAREAMILAVQTFNSPGVNFKTEVFSVLANIAWTYLLHEYFERKKVSIYKKDGQTISLSAMLERDDCPVTDGTRNNLRALKIIRDKVEHHLLGGADPDWHALYQACCLNFDRTICELFGDKLSLSNELSLALQFARMEIGQLGAVQSHDLPKMIKAVDAELTSGMSDEQIGDLHYRFGVVYTLTSTSKSKAHIRFVSPDSPEGTAIENILVKYRDAGESHPYRASEVAKLVQNATGERFTLHNHTQAWRLHKVRPRTSEPKTAQVNDKYCAYHSLHKEYSYSQDWVDLLTTEWADPKLRKRIKAKKLHKPK